MPLFNTEDLNQDIEEYTESGEGQTPATLKRAGYNRNIYIFGRRNQAAADHLGAIEDNQILHYVSAGAYDTINIIIHILNWAGPANMYVGMWTISEAGARQIIKMIDQGIIKNFKIIFDHKIKVRTPEIMGLLFTNFQEMYFSQIHAKVIVIENHDRAGVIVTSANITQNPRLEAGIIDTSRTAVDFHKKWILEEIKRIKKRHQDNERKTGQSIKAGR